MKWTLLNTELIISSTFSCPKCKNCGSYYFISFTRSISPFTCIASSGLATGVPKTSYNTLRLVTSAPSSTVAYPLTLPCYTWYFLLWHRLSVKGAACKRGILEPPWTRLRAMATYVCFFRILHVPMFTRGSPFNCVVSLAKGQAKFTFYSTAIHHWNSLPNEIKSISDFKLFKKLVKNHLVDYTSIGYWAGLNVVCLCFLINSVLPFSFVMFLSSFSYYPACKGSQWN